MKTKSRLVLCGLLMLAISAGFLALNAAEKEKPNKNLVRARMSGTILLGGKGNIPFYVYGEKKVRVDLFKISEEKFFASAEKGEIDITGMTPIASKGLVKGKLQDMPPDERLDRRANQAPNAPAVRRFRGAYANGSFDLPKKAGIYLVVAGQDGDRLRGNVYLVTDVALMARRDNKRLLVMAFDGKDSKPIAGLKLEFIDGALKVLGEAVTDENGTASFDINADDQKNIVVRARRGESLAVMSAYYWHSSLTETKAYFYADRPVYRPSQKVHFKCILRDAKDEEYKIPAGKVSVEIKDKRYNPVYNKTFELNEFGTFSGEMELAEEPTLGYYQVYVRYGDKQQYAGRFKVEEYKKPEYKIEVKTDKDSYLFGDEITASIKADYYFGSPVVEGKGKYRIYQQPRRFYGWYPWRRYGWYYSSAQSTKSWLSAYSWGRKMVASGEFETGRDGTAVVKYKLPEKIVERQRYPYNRGYEYVVEAILTDKSRREVSEAASAPVSDTEFFLSMYTNQWMYKPSNNVVATIRATTPSGGIVKNQEIEFTVYRDNYTNKKPDYKKQFAKKLITDEKGIAKFEFIPDIKGRFRIELVSKDTRGKKVVAECNFWVIDQSYQWPRYDYASVEIMTDKESYKPGDTMQVMINAPKGLSVGMLTIEGSNIIEHRSFKFNEGTKVFQYKVGREYMPNISIKVSTLQNNNTVTALKSVIVPPEEKFLTVSIKPDKDKYKPREESTFVLEVKDNNGKPVRAEVSLGVVDASIYAIASSSERDIRQYFYGPRYSRVSEFATRFWVDDGRGFGMEQRLSEGAEPEMSRPGTRAARTLSKGKAGGGGYVEPVTRENFADTALWLAHVTTDAQGRAVVKMKMPDNLTTWTLTARVVTLDTKVGEGKEDTLVRKDLIIRLETPRVLVQSDEATISAVVHNYLSKTKRAKVILKAEGVEIEGDVERMVEISKDSDVRVDWKIKAGKALPAVFTASALTDEESDAMKLTIPVLPHGMEKHVAKSGMVMEGGKEVEIDLPGEIIPEATNLQVTLSPSVSNTMFDALEYLVGYPYGCVEQTMSRFLPDVMVTQVLQKLGRPNKELEAKLPDMINKGLQRLYSMQHGDGGWGWWKNDQTHPYMTAYVIYGLTLAQQAGVEVSDNALRRGIDQLKRMIKRADDPNTKAYMAFALSFSKNVEEGVLVDLMKNAEKLNDYSLSILSIALRNQGRENDANSIVKTLLKNAQDDGNICRWEGKVHRGHGSWMSNPVETTAYALRALVRNNPNDERLGRVLVYLSSKRTGQRWHNTKDTAAVVYALADYVVMTKELFPDMEVLVNINEKKKSLKIDRDNLFEKIGRVITIPGDDLKRGKNIITIIKKGKGRIYYSAHLTYYSVEKKIAAASNGMTVKREYFKLTPKQNKREIVFEDKLLEDGATLKSGDRVKVRITLEAPVDREYVIVEDYFPSGFEVAEDLATPQARWWYTQQEFRDEKAAFFCTYYYWNRKNQRVFEYVLRAETPGVYHALPARASSMYVKNIGGNSDETILKIKD